MGSSVIRENEAIFGANKGNGTQTGQEEILDQLNPQLSQFPLQSILSLTSQHLSGSSQDRVRLPGSNKGHLVTKGQGARSNEVGIPQYPGKVSRAGLETAGCVNYRA